MELSPPEHQHSENVILAAQWLADQHGAIARPIVELQQRYGLNAKESCEACALASRMRTLRSAMA